VLDLCFACHAVALCEGGSFIRHFISLSGGFASRRCVGSRYGSLHPNHWSLASPGLVPATALLPGRDPDPPPTRAAPARAGSSFACHAVALAEAGASPFFPSLTSDL
jgi:hypothetical protein